MSKGLEALDKIEDKLIEMYDFLYTHNPSLFNECDGNVKNYVKVNYKIPSIEKELKALEIIRVEFLNRSDFRFKIEKGSDVILVIEEWILDHKVNEMKIPFDRNFEDLFKEVLSNE